MEADVIERSIEFMDKMEAENAQSVMKLDKAPGPTGVSSEMLLAAGCKEKKLFGKYLQIDCNKNAI